MLRWLTVWYGSQHNDILQSRSRTSQLEGRMAFGSDDYFGNEETNNQWVLLYVTSKIWYCVWKDTEDNRAHFATIWNTNYVLVLSSKSLNICKTRRHVLHYSKLGHFVLLYWAAECLLHIADYYFCVQLSECSFIFRSSRLSPMSPSSLLNMANTDMSQLKEGVRNMAGRLSNLANDVYHSIPVRALGTSVIFCWLIYLRS